MQVPVNFNPRHYQLKALEALDNGVSLAVWCWARRGGKDFTAFGYAVKKMVEKPMSVVLVWPTQKQGYDNFWTNIENDGMKTLDHIPESLIAAKVSSPNNMKVTLKNGSTLTLLGATEADKLRGANGKLYIFSEFVDLPADALDVIRPIVLVNGGQIIIQSTPKIDGISGGTFKILFDRALANWTTGPKTQYASLITAHEYLTDEQLEEIRQETIAKNGNDFWFRQEFLCDWGQASATSYYGTLLGRLKEHGHIGNFPHNPELPVYTVRDMGISDNLALGFFQYYRRASRLAIHVIDYFEIAGAGNEAVVKYLTSKPYNYMWHFFPHDGAVRDSDLTPRIEKHRELGLLNSSLLPREPKEDGITRVIEMLPSFYFNEPTTEELTKKLTIYKRAFNPLTGDYIGPEHKTESHGADMVRYLCKAIELEFKKTGEFLYSPAMQASHYQSNLVQTPSQYRGY